ncbi:hypothetical protein B0H63DRAFT_31532 [Podospora didyma]|uniref:Uncharacterized protein n=1 Tax=Podospora didyma TaxID=330526 RepID=A0AAE0P616_9PEZI|nr:hypothetical protein B0H63DRAFT_31532 [Podospora didyma]
MQTKSKSEFSRQWRSGLVSVSALAKDAKLKARSLWVAMSCFYLTVKSTLLPGMAPLFLDKPPSSRRDTQLSPVSICDMESMKASGRGKTTSLPRSHSRRSLGPLNSDADNVEDVAVAIELKFLLQLPARGKGPMSQKSACQGRSFATVPSDDEHRRLEEGHETIASTIRGIGESAVTSWSIKANNLEERVFWPSHWIVKKANSVEPSKEERSMEGYDWIPTEVCSPKLRSRDRETHRRVEKVLNALSSAHCLVTNYTCEVHVHLGRMDDKPFSLPTLKRLGTLLWVSEPALRSIRDPNSPNYHNIYTWGAETRRYSRLAQSLTGQASTDGTAGDLSASNGKVEDVQVAGIFRNLNRKNVGLKQDVRALQTIWSAASYRDLGLLMSGETQQYRRLGFNFSAFGLEDKRAQTNPRTIEFRIMEGTVRSDLILGWLVICSAVTEAAVLRSDARFDNAVSRLLRELNDPSGGTGSGGSGETLAVRRGREFRELMNDLRVPKAAYRPFHEKIISQYLALDRKTKN